MGALSPMHTLLNVNQEDYLLRARSRSTPYKQIAAYLHKTELACRLHHHQMTFGAQRRPDALTVNVARSEGSHSPRSIEENTFSCYATPTIMVTCSSSPCRSFSPSPASTSAKSSTSPCTSTGTESHSPEQHQKPQLMTSTYNHGIGLTWPHASSSMLPPPSAVKDHPDLSRALHEYAKYNSAFWSSVASQYGSPSQSPSELEAAFYSALERNGPPSPRSVQPYLTAMDWSYVPFTNSPRASSSKPQETINDILHSPSPKRCISVSSLLNLEKDTGSNKWSTSGP